MRLIDIDAVIKNALTDTEAEYLKSIARNAPTIDAVPVVRCKDCTYYCPLDDSRPYDCLRSGMLCVRKDDFCSFAERKNDE